MRGNEAQAVSLEFTVWLVDMQYWFVGYMIGIMNYINGPVDRSRSNKFIFADDAANFY